MKPATFFKVSLVLPLLLPLALMPFGMELVTGLLVLSIAFGGIQYILFAILMFYVIEKLKKGIKIQQLSFFAPILFIPIQAGGWVIYGYYDKFSNPQVTGIWDPVLPFAFYTLIVGYPYVLFVNLVYFVCKRSKLIAE